MGREQIFQKIGRFDAHAAQVRQSGPPAFAIQFAQTAEQPFDADEIPFRMPPGILDEKRSVATTQFNLQRLRFGKQLRQIQSFDDGRQFIYQIGGNFGSSCHFGRNFTRPPETCNRKLQSGRRHPPPHRLKPA